MRQPHRGGDVRRSPQCPEGALRPGRPRSHHCQGGRRADHAGPPDQGCWLETETTSPVIKVAYWLARNTITLATSQVSAAGPKTSLRLSSSSSSSDITLFKKGWWARLGETALTRTL